MKKIRRTAIEIIKFFDIEADGLLHDATKAHCIVTKQLYRQETEEFTTDNIQNAIISLSEANVIVCHNLWGYDLPLLEKLYGLVYDYRMFNNKPMQIIDTLAWSRKLWPDRPLPKGCPTHVNTAKGKKEVSPHGLDAWAYRVAGKKPEVVDWKSQPMDVYLERCREDVLVTEKTFLSLCEEGSVEL